MSRHHHHPSKNCFHLTHQGAIVDVVFIEIATLAADEAVLVVKLEVLIELVLAVKELLAKEAFSVALE